MSGQLIITIRDEQADPERLDDLSRSLRRELLDFGVNEVEQVRREAPPGTRAVDLAVLGVLMVVVKESAQAIGGIVTLVRSWLSSAPAGRSVELTVGDKTLKVSSASPEQQDQLISEFVAALHRSTDPSPSATAAPPS